MADVCANCYSEDVRIYTSRGGFCSDPCVHEHQGWPDCSHQGPGFEKYPACDLHAEVDAKARAKGRGNEQGV